MVARRYGICLPVFNSISHSFAELIHEILSWTLEEEFLFPACQCITHYVLSLTSPAMTNEFSFTEYVGTTKFFLLRTGQLYRYIETDFLASLESVLDVPIFAYFCSLLRIFDTVMTFCQICIKISFRSGQDKRKQNKEKVQKLSSYVKLLSSVTVR